LLNAGQCNSRRCQCAKDSEVADRDLQFACRKNRLDEQSGGTPNAMMSILTLSSPKETAARDSVHFAADATDQPPRMHVAHLQSAIEKRPIAFFTK
jgi:hypothetical protein